MTLKTYRFSRRVRICHLTQFWHLGVAPLSSSGSRVLAGAKGCPHILDKLLWLWGRLACYNTDSSMRLFRFPHNTTDSPEGRWSHRPRWRSWWGGHPQNFPSPFLQQSVITHHLPGLSWMLAAACCSLSMRLRPEEIPTWDLRVQGMQQKDLQKSTQGTGIRNCNTEYPVKSTSFPSSHSSQH